MNMHTEMTALYEQSEAQATDWVRRHTHIHVSYLGDQVNELVRRAREAGSAEDTLIGLFASLGLAHAYLRAGGAEGTGPFIPFDEPPGGP
jgi:hypothetical protein